MVSVGGRESLRRYELPLGCEILDLLELEDRGLAFADDRHPFALLGQQHHRPCHRRSQFHSAVIFQCNKLFRVYCHWCTPTLTAGLEASAHAPNANSKSKPSVVNACLPDVSGVGFATRIALASSRAYWPPQLAASGGDSPSGRVSAVMSSIEVLRFIAPLRAYAFPRCTLSSPR